MSNSLKNLRVVFILHVQVLTGNVLCGASPVHFALYAAHPIHTSCVHILIKLCGCRIPWARPQRLFMKSTVHLTNSSTLCHCCDQQRTSSLTQTLRLLRLHKRGRFRGSSATESVHDETINSNGHDNVASRRRKFKWFSREVKRSPHPLQEKLKHAPCIKSCGHHKPQDV